jgi:hypothetical protein
MLPRDIARCPGEMYVPPEGQVAALSDECQNCARRTEGVRDYMGGAPVAWMTPPGETPCQMKLEPKQ